jgi:hypothetical protein
MDLTQKITFGEMREMGVRGVVVCCQDYKCSHSRAISADQWSDDLRLSDIEQQFVCKACGKRGADVRPDFNSIARPVSATSRRLRKTPANHPSFRERLIFGNALLGVGPR